MGKVSSKVTQNDLESDEVRKPLNRFDSRDYTCNYSWKQQNVDSSNLPSFIKITRPKEDAIFGRKRKKNVASGIYKSYYSLPAEESRKTSDDSILGRKCKSRIPISSNAVAVAKWLERQYAIFVMLLSWVPIQFGACQDFSSKKYHYKSIYIYLRGM